MLHLGAQEGQEVGVEEAGSGVTFLIADSHPTSVDGQDRTNAVHHRMTASGHVAAGHFSGDDRQWMLKPDISAINCWRQPRFASDRGASDTKSGS